MNSRQKTSARRAYTRPEVWVVPCQIPAIMGPSRIHAAGSDWINNPESGLNWNDGLPSTYNPSGSFGFKSVWEAKAKVLQDGQIVEVPLD